MGWIRWQMAEPTGVIRSKCGRYKIVPVYNGEKEIQYYELRRYYDDNSFSKGLGGTIDDCKGQAEEWALDNPSVTASDIARDFIEMSTEEVESYLKDAEDKAISALAHNKWERFGYWASQSVHLRQLLGLSHTKSPFKPFADLARQMQARQSDVDSEE